MTNHPIIMSGLLVRAILDNRKTQTRRPLKVPKGYAFLGIYGPGLTAIFEDRSLDDRGDWAKRLPSIGDRLYVRETFRIDVAESPPIDVHGHPTCTEVVEYRADDDGEFDGYLPWTPSIHMPKALARIWLRVTDVRVQRIQDISEEDAFAEGCRPQFDKDVVEDVNGIPMNPHIDARQDFQKLWNSIYPDSWERNDWVGAYTFEREV